jgi:Fe2+ transport system protein FeoA
MKGSAVFEVCCESQNDACTPCPGASDPCAARATLVSLSQLRRGQTGKVNDSTLSNSDAALLRAMGLRPQASVRLSRVGEPCIVVVGSAGNDCGCGSVCRIGLARALADRIMVSVES